MSMIDHYYYGSIFTPQTNALLERIQPLIEPNLTRYVDKFYDVLLSDPGSAKFLSNELVEQRLKTSMTKWLRETTKPKTKEYVVDSMRYHQSVGEVHARAEIPMSLVDVGMTILKGEIFTTLILAKHSTQETAEAVTTLNRLLDSALSIINDSYMRGKVTNERTSQEFITASSAQEVALEIERIKSSIYQWMTSTLLAHKFSTDAFNESLFQKDFGLWIRHKLPLISADTKRAGDINAALELADQACTALAKSDTENEREQAAKLTDTLKEIIWLLTDEADRNLAKESKQDSLTTLLDRRFLSPILQQETAMALQGQNSFSVIMLDLDHFKRINDIYGHGAGDIVLRHASKTIKDKIRLTDYVFRYGGEEVLVVAPELGLEDAVKLAERIRVGIEQLHIELADQRHVKATASLGVATFNGHPDYQRLLNEADAKLYEAKRSGRNCVRY
ncbi:GGDEF domain-containing protein [Bowmanella pacifica]|nr:GGDEF domain-containing protein [Bowmanella pacifica]